MPKADLPRGEPEERKAVIGLLKEANAQQWIIVNYHVQELNGRIAQVSGVRRDGLRRAIVDDSEASSHLPDAIISPLTHTHTLTLTLSPRTLALHLTLAP